MRVLILTNNDVGLYKFRKELLAELLKDNEVFISLPNGGFVDEMEKMGCIYLETEFNRKGTNPVGDLKLLKKYLSIINEIKPDIVLSYTIKPNVYGGIACQIKHVPYVANVTGLGSSIENKGILQIISSLLYKTGLRKAQKVFFQNEDNMKFMIENRIVKENCEVIPGSGVNVDEYQYFEYPNSEKISFVFVSRLMIQKGTGLYLQAAEKLKEKYSNTIFHICGPDEDGYLDEVKKLEEEGIVKYHGLVKDMTDIYKMISCTVHPSFYAEGLSNVLLESCACGRPIITTDRSGCKEVVNDGYNGYLVKQKDLNDLIDKMEKFIKLSYEEKKQMSVNARKLVENDFDRRIIIRKYLEEINKCKNQ